LPQSVAIGDFNKDGKLDLAVTNVFGGSVSVLMGNGNGSFQPQVQYPVAGLADALVVDDFNGDGELDIAVSVTCQSHPNCVLGSVTVLNGHGDGTFLAGPSYAVGPDPNFLAVGYFSGNSKPDLVTTNYYSSTMSLLVNKAPH
jgi:hypothetical protein